MTKPGIKFGRSETTILDKYNKKTKMKLDFSLEKKIVSF